MKCAGRLPGEKQFADQLRIVLAEPVDKNDPKSVRKLRRYRHGLRASELCDLQWHQVEINTGRLHVRRSKKGTPLGASNAGRRNSRPAAPAA
jgi:integrase